GAPRAAPQAPTHETPGRRDISADARAAADAPAHPQGDRSDEGPPRPQSDARPLTRLKHMSSPTPESALAPVNTAAPRRVRVHHLREAKQRGERLTMLTAYDTPTAQVFDTAGIDMLLVGDSYADNILGLDSTLPVTMDELIPAVRAVSRGAKRAMVVADL